MKTLKEIFALFIVLGIIFLILHSILPPDWLSVIGAR